ncbi:hypothetical protein BDN72DRAFT_846739 [Pluteus cervinus]|uniref:Uncharacterized protein n=1 Tax=Pluteus cervinus TaxID=181527 RepID=A0ACD3AFU8_9AGAR|nr:hypothetical protein BDN72DRAFT_846739 [Pluteus cervinus]
MVRLALDILEEIARHLQNDKDRLTLSSLSLVSSSLLEPCRKHLFYTVSFHDQTPKFPSTYQKFDKVLQETPRIGEYVREIHLLINDFQESDTAPFHSILNHITKPTNLVISPFVLETQHTVIGPWEQLPCGFREGVERIVGYPTLRSLSFDRIRMVPVSLIARASNLCYLDFFTASLITTTPATATPGSSVKPFLNHLGVKDCTSWSYVFSPIDNPHNTFTSITRALPFDLTHLTHLELDVNCVTAKATQGLIDQSSLTLQSLSFAVTGAGMISLKSVQNLRVLTFILNLGTFVYPPGPETHSAFFNIVRSLDAECPLQDGIVIGAYNCTSILSLIPATVWKRVDDLLINIGRKTLIRTTDTTETWKKLLPRSDLMGILTITPGRIFKE